MLLPALFDIPRESDLRSGAGQPTPLCGIRTTGATGLRPTGGQAQIWELDVRGGKGAQSSLEHIPVPEQYRWAPPQGPGTNVAQAYARFARDYREGTHLCPTFDDAVTRHRMLNAIETPLAVDVEAAESSFPLG